MPRLIQLLPSTSDSDSETVSPSLYCRMQLVLTGVSAARFFSVRGCCGLDAQLAS
jgi:hypothetical protein